jgi:hypothetical protein
LQTIPDLAADGEEEKDDITDKIAHAPNVLAHRVQNLSDLDSGYSQAPAGNVRERC